MKPLFSKSEIAKMPAEAKKVAREANKRARQRDNESPESVFERLFRLKFPEPLAPTVPHWPHPRPKDYDAFFRRQGEHGSTCLLDGMKPGTVVSISCPCPKCSPWSL